MRIELTGRFRRGLRRLDGAGVDAAQGALDEVLAGFGRPHAHTGLGIRKLKGHWFECRAGLDLRLVFLAGQGVLTFHVIGNHDDVRRFLASV